MTATETLHSAAGHWRSVGYNRALSISDRSVSTWHVTASSSKLVAEESIGDFLLGHDRFRLDNSGLELYYRGDLTRYRYQPLSPSDLLRPEGKARDNHFTLQALGEVFRENYAFFHLSQADWEASLQRAHNQLIADASDGSLASIARALIEPLEDTHVYIDMGSAGTLHSRSPKTGGRTALKTAFGMPTDRISPRSTVDAIAPKIDKVLLQPFEATRTPLRQGGNAIASWCLLEPGIGYLSLLRLFGFADSERARQADDLPHAPRDAGPFLEADMAALNATLDRAFSDLQGCRALVIDVRINGGGFDRAGVELAARLVAKRSALYRKKAVWKSGYTPTQTICVTPAAERPGFHGPVFLLTSAMTLSAGEVLTMALASLPNVTVLGERTLGILSDNMFHRFPNDWEVSLSNEVYETLGGECHEREGVPADHALPPVGDGSVEALRAGLAEAVNMARGAAP